jgi:hypothetical protein
VLAPDKTMSLVIRAVRKAKQYRCHTGRFATEMRKRKQYAHRLERHRVKQAIRQGKEYVPKPLLTDWDII